MKEQTQVPNLKNMFKMEIPQKIHALRRLLPLTTGLFIFLLWIPFSYFYTPSVKIGANCLSLEIAGEKLVHPQLYYDIGNGFNEKDSVTKIVHGRGHEFQKISFPLPDKTINHLRLDVENGSFDVKIKNIQVGDKNSGKPFEIENKSVTRGGGIKELNTSGSTIHVVSEDNAQDPILLINLQKPLNSSTKQANYKTIFFVVSILVILAATLLKVWQFHKNKKAEHETKTEQEDTIGPWVLLFIFYIPVSLCAAMFYVTESRDDFAKMEVELAVNCNAEAKLYYDMGGGLSELNAIRFFLRNNGSIPWQRLTYQLPAGRYSAFRFDVTEMGKLPSNSDPTKIMIHRMSLCDSKGNLLHEFDLSAPARVAKEGVEWKDDILHLETKKGARTSSTWVSISKGIVLERSDFLFSALPFVILGGGVILLLFFLLKKAVLTSKWKLPASAPALFLSSLFFVKACVLAFFITPLWNLPDEHAHVASVMEIADAHTLPLLGKSTVPLDIQQMFEGQKDCPPMIQQKWDQNYIAQHPPVYHILATIPYKVGKFFTNDREILYRLPRIVSALSGALVLFFLYQTFLMLGASKTNALLLAAIPSVIPMYSHLSSGTNNDITLLLFSVLSALYFVKFLLTENKKCAYFSMFWISLAATTKMTALVVFPLLLLFLLLELRGTIFEKLRHVFALGVTMVALPSLWMLRNIYYFHNPLFTAEDIPRLYKTSLPTTFIEYLGKFPVIEAISNSFFGAFGWLGTTRGVPVALSISGFPTILFSILSFTLTLCILFSVLKQFFNEDKVGSECAKGHLKIPSIPLAAIALGVSFFFAVALRAPANSLSWMQQATVCILLFSALLSAKFIFPRQKTNRLMFYSLALFAFFGIVLLQSIYKIYLFDGTLRATHGRYFYPVLPYLFIALCIAVGDRKKMTPFLFGCVALAAFLEFYIYNTQVLPFYNTRCAP
jgi:hypothetical protein